MAAQFDPRNAEPGDAWLESVNGQSWLLQGRCNLGRGAENHIVIDSPKASRKHAFIHPQDEGEFWLIDLFSRNGTFRNDRRLVRPTRLRHGDSLYIGGQNFTFCQPVCSHKDEGTVVMGRSSTGGDATVLDLRPQNLWLLIADIMDFTAMSVEMEVEKLASTMGHWLHECHRIVERDQGRIPKYIGDGFLACWEDRGVDTAPAVIAAVREFQQLRKDSDIRFRVALHYGTVTFGEQSAWGEPSMLGPEMNYIFRLEDLASKLGVGFCLSSSAQAKLGELLAVEPVPGEHKLKGFNGLHTCYSVREAV